SETFDARYIYEHGVAAGVRDDFVVGVKLRREAAREGERAREVLRRHVAYAVGAKTCARLERVCADSPGGVVLKLEAILIVQRKSDLRAAACEGVEHAYGRVEAPALLPPSVALVLE